MLYSRKKIKLRKIKSIEIVKRNEVKKIGGDWTIPTINVLL